MSTELLCVEGCTLDFRTNPQPLTITILPVSVLSSHVKGSGNKVYISISFSVAGYVATGISAGAGAGVITGTATKVKTDSGLVPVREEDDVLITITDTVSPYNSTTDTVYVKIAGQTKAKGV